VGIVLALLPVLGLTMWWLTIGRPVGLAWPGLVAGITCMVALTWRLVKMFAAMRAALKQAERERDTLQEALRKA
jgi:predicted ABC-type exoprotein transport system permease subunit